MLIVRWTLLLWTVLAIPTAVKRKVNRISFVGDEFSARKSSVKISTNVYLSISAAKSSEKFPPSATRFSAISSSILMVSVTVNAVFAVEYFVEKKFNSEKKSELSAPYKALNM